MPFTPLDILYLVLAFCALWITAAGFWLLWQLANIFKNVNDTLEDARDKMNRLERVLGSIREKFDHASSVMGIGVSAIAKVVEYAIEKKSRRDEEDYEETKISKKKSK